MLFSHFIVSIVYIIIIFSEIADVPVDQRLYELTLKYNKAYNLYMNAIKPGKNTDLERSNFEEAEQNLLTYTTAALSKGGKKSARKSSKRKSKSKSKSKKSRK